MRKTLLSIILPLTLITANIQAQDKVWDFGNDDAWPESGAVTATTEVDGLTLHPEGGSSFGVVDGNNASWDDGYTATKRFKFGGNSGIDPAEGEEFMPTRRYLSFPIDGPVSVKIWFRASSTGTPRALYVTDGTMAVGHYDSLGDTDPRYIEMDYTGAADQLYILCAGNAFNLYKIEVSSTLLNTKKVSGLVTSNVAAIGSKIVVSNVKTPTEITIYNVMGARVNSFRVTNNTEFEFNSGLYIATIKTSEGQKSVKMVVR